MRVWILQLSEPLPIDAEAKKLRTALLSEQLVARGHSVVWWASSFNHLRKKWFVKEDVEFRIAEGFTVKTLKGCGYKKNVSFSRILDHRIIAHKFRKAAQAMACPDIIISSMPSYDLAYEAVRYAKQKNIPVVVDIRDQWPDNFLDVVPEKLRRLARFFLAPEFNMSKFAMRNASGLLSMTEDLLDWGLANAERPQTWKDKSFPLGCMKIPISSTANTTKILQIADRLKDKFVVSFIGTFGTYHNPALIIEAAIRTKNQNYCFVLAGDGELFEELRHKASGLTNVILTGWLNHEEIAALLRQSSVGVCPSGYTGKRAFFPNKVFTYLAEGLPVLSALHGEIERVVEQCGVGYNYCDLEGFLSALDYLYNNPEAYADMRRKAFNLFDEKYDASKVYCAYADHIEKIQKDETWQ